jgi:hypothetical protein
MTEIGPVQLLAIAFGPEAEYQGQIMDELERLESKGFVRVLDLLFVGEDADAGQVVAFDYQGDALGGLVGLLLGFPFENDVNPTVMKAPAGLGEGSVGLSRPVLEDMLSKAPPDVAIGLLLIEHVWARDFKNAIRAAHGTPLFEGFLSAELLAVAQDELEETVRIFEELEAEAASSQPLAG